MNSTQMKKMNLTQRIVDSAVTPRDGRPYDIWDTGVPAFRLEKRPSGRMGYFLHFRIRGNERVIKTKIGNASIVSLKDARSRAKQILWEAYQGEDPRIKTEDGPTVADVCSRFIDEHAIPSLKPRSVSFYNSIIVNHVVPSLGKIKIEKLSKIDVVSIHTVLRDKPSVANSVLATISALCNFAERLDLRPQGMNPCEHVSKYKLKPRQRVLTRAEIAAFGGSLRKFELKSPVTVSAIRALALTGCRLREILCLEWSHVDLESRRINLRDAKRGPRSVPIGEPAVLLFESLGRFDGNPFCFPGRSKGCHLSNPNRLWRKIREDAGIDDVRLHDLRRSFASRASAENIDIRNIAAILGHADLATTKMYAVPVSEALLDAADKTSSAIDRLMSR